MRDYYRDAVLDALFEQPHILGFALCKISKTADLITDNVLANIENESMATGRDCIPNPLHAEVAEQKRLRESDNKASRKTIENLESENDDLRRQISRLLWEQQSA